MSQSKLYEVVYSQAGLTGNTTVFAPSTEDAKNHVVSSIPYAKVLTCFVVNEEMDNRTLLCE